MAGQLLSTTNVPERDRFAYWREAICDVFVHLDCSSPERAAFAGSIYNQPFAQLQMSSMRSNQMTVNRSPRQIAKSSDDCLLVALQGQGRSVGSQGGREANLEPGDLALFDSTRPYDVRFEPGFQHCVLKIPRPLLMRRVGRVAELTAVRISAKRGMGRIVSRYLKSLPKELDGLDAQAARQVAETSLDLFASALAGLTPGAGLPRSTTRTGWRFRVQSFLETHLHDPELSPGAVADALGVSVRYLNSILAEEQTSLGRAIWTLRLARCREALADRRQVNRNVGEIAFEWGFNDMSHFSRAFSAKYGMSPRDYRAVSTAKGQ